MPDILTTTGLFQHLAMAAVLFGIIFLRTVRSGRRVMPSFAPFWLVISIGAGVYAIVERGLAIDQVAVRLLVVAALPIILAIIIDRFRTARRTS